MTAIYGLIDPRDGALKYIGKADDADKRYATHMRDSARRKTPVYAWIRKLVTLGLVPDMLVLSVCENWHEEERRLIAAARQRGYPLLNVAEGGNQPFCPPDVRSANGHKSSAAREADPVKKTIHRYLQRMGHVFQVMAKTATPEQIAQRSVALAKAKRAAAENPQGFYDYLLSVGFSAK